MSELFSSTTPEFDRAADAMRSALHRFQKTLDSAPTVGAERRALREFRAYREEAVRDLLVLGADAEKRAGERIPRRIRTLMQMRTKDFTFRDAECLEPFREAEEMLDSDDLCETPEGFPTITFEVDSELPHGAFDLAARSCMMPLVVTVPLQTDPETGEEFGQAVIHCDGADRSGTFNGKPSYTIGFRFEPRLGVVTEKSRALAESLKNGRTGDLVFGTAFCL